MKYLVVPGYVFSKNDHDRHFISAARLIHLYNVPKSLCIILDEDKWIKEGHKKKYQGLVLLRPKYDGNYKIESEAGE